MAAAGYVLTCVHDDGNGTCTDQEWLPPPQLIPRLSVVDAGQILTGALLVLAWAWGWKKLNRSVSSH